MTYYVIVETPVEVYEGEIQSTRRGWLKAETLKQAQDLQTTYSRLGSAEIVTSVKDLEFDLNEIEGIPV